MAPLVPHCNTKLIHQLDANNFIMILSHKWPLHVSDMRQWNNI